MLTKRMDLIIGKSIEIFFGDCNTVVNFTDFCWNGLLVLFSPLISELGGTTGTTVFIWNVVQTFTLLNIYLTPYI